MNAGGLAPLALAVSLALGAAGVGSLFLLVRVRFLNTNANARFVLWLALLVALACAVPVFVASGSVSLQRAPSVSIETTPSVASSPRVNVADAVAVLWFLGFTLSLLRVCAGVARLRHIRRGAAAIEMRPTSRGQVMVLTSEHFSVPVAIGYHRPAILIPRAMLALERTTDFENVLLHEIEHLRRFDDMTSLVQALCMCALWFNPFAYYICARANIEREMACDEAVVAKTGKRATYAATLWKIATDAQNAATPALISAFTSRSHTAPRLKNLLVERGGSKPAPRLRSFFVAAFVAMTFVGTAALAPAMVVAPSPLTDYTSLRLAHGQTLIVGGRREDGAPYSAIQVYDRSGRRTALLAMPLPRWSATATLLHDGDVLIKGGKNATGALQCKLVYDPARNRFTKT